MQELTAPPTVVAHKESMIRAASGVLVRGAVRAAEGLMGALGGFDLGWTMNGQMLEGPFGRLVPSPCARCPLLRLFDCHRSGKGLGETKDTTAVSMRIYAGLGATTPSPALTRSANSSYASSELYVTMATGAYGLR